MPELLLILVFQLIPLLIIVYVLYVLTSIRRSVERIERRLDEASGQGRPGSTPT